MTTPATPTSTEIRRSPLLDRPGAVAGDREDAGVAAHYGDPMREQRLLVEGLAAVDLSHRGVVTVTGPDRLSWLHSITTQQVTGLAPRTSVEDLVLSPKGHVEHVLHLVDDGETTWLTVEPGTAPALVAWLRSMQFMLRVEVADVSAEHAVVGEPIRAEGADGEPPTWCDPWPRLGPDTAAYGPVEGHPGEERRWREVIVPRGELVGRMSDRPLAGTWAAEALRVAAWRPRLGFETDHRTIAHEVDWLRTAVHLHKGCYRGQETIARVHNLGRPPRRLAFVHLDGSGHVLPERDAAVEVEGRAVGRLTSVARHYEDGPIGLVMLKRNTPLEAELMISGISAAQQEIVPR
ncbi:CAF17-like 4Fe-4S cluster assembly/insertion protein YgfZ [Arsenicicoccus sp. oral taxon 190]|uniref:CAF17-like 4Fe-4S cluster assembly/insertion protein YgfZ n=1 Tax=Arsenicicoccus sp. oral taxon 190 TaxID=1658671 RepID=UPI00067A01A1|nr:folate-binding protein YgfZ [Arsenicicoccus sp. oral taxon 190]AKT50299.1 aminomethyltransferase [Arsenicicoccus sp. oral taxon 190]